MQGRAEGNEFSPAGARAGRRGTRCRGGAGAGRSLLRKREGAVRCHLEVEWRDRLAGESARSQSDGPRHSRVARGPSGYGTEGKLDSFTYYMYAC
jgi:hypothetical protein